MGGYIVVLCTAGSVEEAERIARVLVEGRLAACVNIVPGVRSVYRWRGRVEESGEVLLLVKTRSELYEKVEEAIRSVHSYEVPEIVALPVEQGLREYLEWVSEAVGPGEPGTQGRPGDI